MNRGLLKGFFRSYDSCIPLTVQSDSLKHPNDMYSKNMLNGVYCFSTFCLILMSSLLALPHNAASGSRGKQKKIDNNVHGMLK